ncbi:hypothetical protein EV182_000054 [Spiromyces aspiralis]|uniref:Uncharacterized protein n=1 Tax=Spiromyces aspiralis TaxID=68401 RepID=A0ACC1HWF9_9FUNG|nr:hypothetical protein EV182_000054 [Spiromyces aspiralis]
MAGNGHDTLLKDPAIEHWTYMRANTYLYFRWTKRTTSLGVLFGLAIPLGLYYVAEKTNGFYDYNVEVRKKDDPPIIAK